MTTPLELSDNHRRVLLATLMHLDEQLSRIDRLARPSEVPSPFADVVNDLTSTQRQLVQDSVARLRRDLVEALAIFGLTVPRPHRGARFSIGTSISFMQIALDEVRPRDLEGYGPLTAEASRAIDGVLSTLGRSLERLAIYVARGADKDANARLARLASAPFDLDQLRTIARIVRDRGLVEVLPLVDALVDTLEHDGFEIAFFGRVSSGKSSLLDTILGTDALPVGVTPVTAVPTRIQYGLESTVHVSFAEGADVEAPIERLAEFVTERENPDNRKRVTQVEVRIPSPRLAMGIAFVDTPGVGSMARAGARQTFAYIPRCDLGVLLVDANGAVTPDDVAVVRAWNDAAVPGLVVVSKADLLSEPDRERMTAYVAEELKRAASVDVSVSAVSAKGADASLAISWFDAKVAPLCAHAREERQTSLRRKLANLREVVIATLRSRLGSRGGDGAEESQLDVRDVSRSVENTLREARLAADGLGAPSAALVDTCSKRIVANLSAVAGQLSEERVVEQAQRAVAESADEIRMAGRQVIEQARSSLAESLAPLVRGQEQLEGVRAEAASGLLTLGALPTELELDIDGLAHTVMRYPFRGSAFWRLVVAQALRERREVLGEGLRRFALRVAAICGATIDRLARAADALLEPERALRARGSAVPGREASSLLEDLRALGEAPSDAVLSEGAPRRDPRPPGEGPHHA